MSNKKKKKRPAGGSSSYRAPAATKQTARRGLLDGIFAPRVAGGSPMPKARRTVARGIATATAIPWLMAAIPVTVLAVWELLVLAGYQGPFTGLNVTFAIPPVTTFADTQIAGKAFRAGIDATGPSSTVIGLGGFALILLFHAAVNAHRRGYFSVQKLRTGSVSIWAVPPCWHVVPITASIGFISLGLAHRRQRVAAFLGAIGVIFCLLGAMVLGVYFFGFAPAIAADEDRRSRTSLVRSIRAARMPGSANLWLAVATSSFSLADAPAPRRPAPRSGSRPPPPLGRWRSS